MYPAVPRPITVLVRLAVLTRPTRLAVEIKPARFAVDTKLAKLAVLTSEPRVTVDRYPKVPRPTIVLVRFACTSAVGEF